MGFDRHIVRSIAVMILAILAYVAPSAVEAHEGHVHCGHHRRTAAMADARTPAATNVASVSLRLVTEMPGKLPDVRRLRTQSVRTTASIRTDDADGGSCPGACKRCCCGTMVCGTLGIAAAPASLPDPFSQAVVMMPGDVAGQAGLGPEALRKPPRTLA